MATIGFPGSYPEQASSSDAFNPLSSAGKRPHSGDLLKPVAGNPTPDPTRPQTLSQTLSQTRAQARFHIRRHARAKASAALGRRRPTPLQGRALEMLGRAVEYLVDSYVFVADGAAVVDGSTAIFSPSQVEAVQLLMRLSQEVFAECREVVPVHRRLLNWSLGRFSRGNVVPRLKGTQP